MVVVRPVAAVAARSGHHAPDGAVGSVVIALAADGLAGCELKSYPQSHCAIAANGFLMPPCTGTWQPGLG